MKNKYCNIEYVSNKQTNKIIYKIGPYIKTKKIKIYEKLSRKYNEIVIRMEVAKDL